MNGSFNVDLWGESSTSIAHRWLYSNPIYRTSPSGADSKLSLPRCGRLAGFVDTYPFNHAQLLGALVDVFKNCTSRSPSFLMIEYNMACVHEATAPGVFSLRVLCRLRPGPNASDWTNR